MDRKEVGVLEAFGETRDCLGSRGALLVAGADPVNPMTIGWGMMGIAWGRPVFAVLVRHSRFTHELMEKADSFTVNIPGEDLDEACTLCGTRSGRDTDKAKECGLTVKKGDLVEARYIADCPLHYECRIVHRNEVIPGALDPGVKSSVYGSGDFHTVYWGEILGVFKKPGAAGNRSS